MQEFTNGQEVEVRTVTCGAGVPDHYERMEYISPWRGRHVCHRIDYRGAHPTFYANDGPDDIRPVRRTVEEIAERAANECTMFPAATTVHACKLAIRAYVREYYGVEIDGE